MWLWTEQEEEFSWIKKSLFRRCVLRDSCLNAGADFMEQMSKGGLFQPVGPEAFLFVDGTQRLKLWRKWCWLKRCLSPSLWWWLCRLCLGQRSLCVMPGSMGPFTMPGSVGLFVSHLGQWGYIMPGSWVTGSCCFIRRSLLLKEITQRHTNTTSLAWIRSLCHAWVSRSLCAMHGSTHLHVACLGHWVSVLCLGQWVSMCHA